MNELKENINPFSINGYLGRKWYFTLGLIVATINIILMFMFCKSIFVQIFELSKTQANYSILSLLTSGAIAHNEIVCYLICAVIGLILSFINNKKRITDLLGNEKHAYILSTGIATLTITQFIPNNHSLLYAIILILTTVCSFVLLLVPGKLLIKPLDLSIANELDNPQIETSKAVSFWKRWFAYIIDATFILGGCTTFLAMGIPDALVPYGRYTMFIGLIITILYFGIMNSNICKGQTLGKMAMGLKTVDKFGNYLSLSQSFIRTFILTFCLTLSYLYLSIKTLYNLEIDEQCILSLAIILGIMFDLLFLFNVKTRQTLHDLAVGSYVVNSNTNRELCDNKMNKAPLIFATILTLFIALPIVVSVKKQSIYLKNPETIQFKENELANNLEKEINAKVTKIQNIKMKDSNNIIVYILTSNINDEELAKQAHAYLKTKTENNITIILHKTINLGNIIHTIQKPYTYDKK